MSLAPKCFPTKEEVAQAMDVLSRHPTPTDFVALALNLRKGERKVESCDFVLHLITGPAIFVKGNAIL